MMKRTGLSRTNYGQLIPYTSSDIANNAQIYDSLKRVLNDVFAWLDQKARCFSLSVHFVFTDHFLV